MRKNQKGFGALEILLLLILISIVSFGSYYVWHNNRNDIMPSESSTTGGPAPGHIVSTSIKLVTGLYMPANVDIKKGSTVTWKITDGGDIPEYGVQSDANSSEVYSSGVLKTGDSFSHTFNTVGAFGWHDKYNGNLTGSVTVTE
jgi:plastocyanin